jgi:hypothetical protein
MIYPYPSEDFEPNDIGTIVSKSNDIDKRSLGGNGGEFNNPLIFYKVEISTYNKKFYSNSPYFLLLLHGMDIILPAIKGNNSFNKW